VIKEPQSSLQFYSQPRPDKNSAVSENDSLSRKSQIRLVFLIVFTVFFGEAIVAFLLYFFPQIPIFIEAFFDALLLIILVSPVLYFGLFRFLIQQLEERQKILRELRQYRNNLEELVAERTADLSETNELLSREIKERKFAEKELLLKTAQLGERVKELNCLYSVSSLFVSPDLTLSDMLQRAVNLIPAGMQFPDITCARIKIENQEVKTANYSETRWKLAIPINLAGKRSGHIEIGYLQEKPRLDEGPFLKEERNLINAIAEQLKNAILQKKIENDLREALRDSRRRREEVSALLEGARTILKNSEFKPAVQTIYYYCKTLIGATAGYVILSDSTGTENEVLFLDPGERSCAVDPSIPMPIRGQRSEDYAKGAAIYENNFKDSPWHALLPVGHVGLENVLFAPMVVAGRPAGVIGLANKTGGFDENDLRLAAAFGELAAVALLNSRTLESLQDSEERFRSVVATAKEGIILVNSRGVIQFWNHGAEKMFGYSTEETSGQNINLIIPNRFQNTHQNALQDVVTTGKSRLSGQTLNLTGIRKDGTEFPLELTLATWKTKDQLFFTGP
jgi:PAS domain S-box-containing protein